MFPIGSLGPTIYPAGRPKYIMDPTCNPLVNQMKCLTRLIQFVFFCG